MREIRTYGLKRGPPNRRSRVGRLYSKQGNYDTGWIVGLGCRGLADATGGLGKTTAPGWGAGETAPPHTCKCLIDANICYNFVGSASIQRRVLSSRSRHAWPGDLGSAVRPFLGNCGVCVNSVPLKSSMNVSGLSSLSSIIG